MDLKRATTLGLAAYAASFILGYLSTFFFKYDLLSSTIPDVVYIYSIAVTMGIMIIFTMWYFKTSTMKPSLMSGMYFGAVTIAVSFILDFVLGILPATLAGASNKMLSYYSHPLFWANLGVILVVCAVTGSYLSKENVSVTSAPVTKTSSAKAKKRKKTSKKSKK